MSYARKNSLQHLIGIAFDPFRFDTPFIHEKLELVVIKFDIGCRISDSGVESYRFPFFKVQNVSMDISRIKLLINVCF